MPGRTGACVVSRSGSQRLGRALLVPAASGLGPSILQIQFERPRVLPLRAAVRALFLLLLAHLEAHHPLFWVGRSQELGETGQGQVLVSTGSPGSPPWAPCT